MPSYGWDIVPADIAMPESGDTVNSAPFSVPRNAISMAIHTPSAFAGGSDSVKLESLDHNTDVATEAWRAVEVFNLADGSFVALDGILANKCTTIPITATGGGVLRFVASADQSGAPVTIKVDFLCA